MSKRKKMKKMMQGSMDKKEQQAALFALMAWFQSQNLHTYEAAHIAALACGVFAAANGKGSLEFLTETMKLTCALCLTENEEA